MAAVSRAVVVGGSVAGLTAAACLAEHVDDVVVVERKEPRPDASLAPQGPLPHVLLLAGLRVLEEVFPGLGDDLRKGGADDGGADPTVLACHWVAAGRTRDHAAFPGNSTPAAMGSRALLESHLRRRVALLPAVTTLRDTATHLAVEHGRVTGVHLRDGGLLEADLVVDATGRSAPLVGGSDLPAPPVTEVVVDLRYTGFLVERRPDDFGSGHLGYVQNTPAIPRLGFALPHEAGAWQIALGGYFGDQAPAEPGGAAAFARTLADQAMVEVVSRPRLGPPSRYTFRSSLRRHWDKVRHPLEGYWPVGDTVASFNPIYGQGMSSAALQARALGDLVGRYGAGPGVAARAARATAKVVDNPWLIAVGGDFVYPGTRGHRPAGQRVVNAYLERVMRAASVDEDVNGALTAVQNLIAPPSSLFAPRIVTRSLREGRAGSAQR